MHLKVTVYDSAQKSNANDIHEKILDGIFIDEFSEKGLSRIDVENETHVISIVAAEAIAKIRRDANDKDSAALAVAAILEAFVG